MAYDSAATKGRLPDAAYGEFVAHELAGARVERIATAVKAGHLPLLRLQGRPLRHRPRHPAAVLADVVPFTPDYLPGYAGALFDYLANDGGLLRRTPRKALERPEASEAERIAHQETALSSRPRTPPAPSSEPTS